jgi:hypothetical protein
MASWSKKHGFLCNRVAQAPAECDLKAQKAFVEEYQKFINITPNDKFADAIHSTMAAKTGY